MPKSETFNMDCVDYLRTCRDKQFSCAIIDPPYSSACLGIEGNSWNGKYGRFGGLFTKYHADLSIKNNVNHASGGNSFRKYSNELDAKNWDSEPPSEEFWNEIVRVCDWLFVFGGNYFPLPPSRNWIVWEKTIPANFSMAMIELCWTSVPGNAKIIKCGAQDKFRFHPCLPAGQKVFFSGVWKNIENVNPGELNQYGKVIETSSHDADYVIEILSDGFVTIATGNHPFLILRGNKIFWVEADRIKVGDELLVDSKARSELCKEENIWRHEDIKQKKDISESGMMMESSAWSIGSFGRHIMVRFLQVCKFIIKMVTRQIIELKISKLYTPLSISGVTPVADLLTDCGKNNATFAESGYCSMKRTGIFIILEKAKDILLGKFAKSALSKKWWNIGRFELNKVGSVQKKEGKIKVYNLTIDGIPAFSTLVGESHNTQKPRLVYDKILEWYGDKFCKEKGILDTFLGSGSSRIAAWDAKIDFVGIELNQVYFQKQEVRFAEHIAKGNLYENTANVVEYNEGLF